MYKILLILTNNQGILVACSEPIAGNYNNAYQLKANVNTMLEQIQTAGINTAGLFLNADIGFDSKAFRDYCDSKEITDNIATNPRNGRAQNYIFDDKLYKCRFVIELTNAWLGAIKALLIRFETNKINWKCLHLLAFIVIFT